MTGNDAHTEWYWTMLAKVLTTSSEQIIMWHIMCSLTLFSPIWFAKFYRDLQIDVSPWRSQLVAYSTQPSKPTKSHCCRQGKRRCVPNMKYRMQNTNTNSTPEQTLKRFSKKKYLWWTSKSSRGIFPTTTKSKHRGILLLTMDGEKTVYA